MTLFATDTFQKVSLCTNDTLLLTLFKKCHYALMTLFTTDTWHYAPMTLFATDTFQKVSLGN